LNEHFLEYGKYLLSFVIAIYLVSESVQESRELTWRNMGN
jgi:hypothetical protein